MTIREKIQKKTVLQNGALTVNRLNLIQQHAQGCKKTALQSGVLTVSTSEQRAVALERNYQCQPLP